MGLVAKMFSKCTTGYRPIPCSKLALEALQEIRIKYRWQAIDQENEMEKAKKEIKSLNQVLSNGDTLKQLLARSRYLLYKNKSKWSEKIERALYI
jgi:hypothetical protein